MSFITAALIGAGGALVAGSMASSASKKAANISADANREATALQRQQYEEGIARQKPFYEAGVNALGQYQQGIQPGGALTRGFTMADYQADPGYNFRLKEGVKALDRSAAARGGLLGGNQMRGLTELGQNLGSQEYQNAYNRFVGEQGTQRNALAGLAGIGQTTANTMGASGAAYGQNVGGMIQQQGVNSANANLYGAGQRASSYGQAANALGKVDWGNLSSPFGNAAVPESPYW